MNSNHLRCENTVSKRCTSIPLKLYTKVYNFKCFGSCLSEHIKIRKEELLYAIPLCFFKLFLLICQHTPIITLCRDEKLLTLNAPNI